MRNDWRKEKWLTEMTDGNDWRKEKWLTERGHSERMVRAHVLKTWGESRNSVLKWINTIISESQLTSNIIYLPVSQNVTSILQELQVWLASDKYHKKSFSKVPIVGFRNGNSPKDYLLKAALPKIENIGSSESCGRGTCKVCHYIIETNTFKTKV